MHRVGTKSSECPGWSNRLLELSWHFWDHASRHFPNNPRSGAQSCAVDTLPCLECFQCWGTNKSLEVLSHPSAKLHVINGFSRKSIQLKLFWKSIMPSLKGGWIVQSQDTVNTGCPKLSAALHVLVKTPTPWSKWNHQAHRTPPWSLSFAVIGWGLCININGRLVILLQGMHLRRKNTHPAGNLQLTASPFQAAWK